MRRSLRWLFPALVLLVLSAVARSQEPEESAGPPRVTLRGSVHDDVGAPVEGATVSLEAQARSSLLPEVDLSGRSGRDGTFMLARVPLGQKLRWEAFSGAHMAAEGVWGGETRLEIVLERAQRVTGRVVDADGNPIGGARLWVMYRAAKEGRSQGSVPPTAEDGSFSFSRQSRWAGVARVMAKGFRRESRRFDELPRPWPAELDLGVFTLLCGRSIRGHVTNAATGAPIEGAALKADWREPENGEKQTVPQFAETTSSADGSYELEGLAKSGAFALLVRKPGYATHALEVAPEREVVDVALGKGGRLDGQVCGTAFELAHSEIWYGSGANQLSNANALAVDGSGRFHLENAEPGTYDLLRGWVVSNPDDPARPLAQTNGWLSAKVTVEEGKAASVRLACDGILLAGTVRRDGRVLGQELVRFAIEKHAVGEALSDESGRFAVRVPSPGRYDVYSYAMPRRKYAVGGCDVPPGGNDVCALDLTEVSAH